MVTLHLARSPYGAESLGICVGLREQAISGSRAGELRTVLGRYTVGGSEVLRAGEGGQIFAAKLHVGGKSCIPGTGSASRLRSTCMSRKAQE